MAPGCRGDAGCRGNAGLGRSRRATADRNARERSETKVGAGGQAIRFLPPLNVKEGEIEQAMKLVDSSLSNFQPNEAGK